LPSRKFWRRYWILNLFPNDPRLSSAIWAWWLLGNRSGSENLTLAIPSSHSIPWRHGNPAGITTRGVGMDPTRGTSLYSGAGSACGDLDIHGPRLTGTGRHIAGPAAPDVTEFFPPPIERSTTASTSTSPTGSTPSWRSTGPSWLYTHPATGGRSR